MLANLLRERVPERLNGTFCQLIVRIHSDSLHPNNSGRVLIADYLRAYLLEALLQLHREAQVVAAGAIVSPEAAVAALPHETMRVGLQPVAMRCYGFLGEHGASIYLPPTTCVRSLACSLLNHPPVPTLARNTHCCSGRALTAALPSFQIPPHPPGAQAVRLRGEAGHDAVEAGGIQGLCLLRVPAARQHDQAQARVDRGGRRQQHGRAAGYPLHGAGQ
jgi:hypothetical protein